MKTYLAKPRQTLRVEWITVAATLITAVVGCLYLLI